MAAMQVGASRSGHPGAGRAGLIADIHPLEDTGEYPNP